MKIRMILVGLLLAAGSLQAAGPITFNTSACNAQRYCTTVYNDADPAVGITVNARTTGDGVSVTVNGVTYTAPAGNALGTLNAVVSITDLTLTSDAGDSIVLNADFYGKRVLHRSGHNYYTTDWVLLSGTVG